MISDLCCITNLSVDMVNPCDSSPSFVELSRLRIYLQVRFPDSLSAPPLALHLELKLSPVCVLSLAKSHSFATLTRPFLHARKVFFLFREFRCSPSSRSSSPLNRYPEYQDGRPMLRKYTSTVFACTYLLRFRSAKALHGN